MKFISSKVHGILDYVVAVALFFAPVLFGFQSVGGAAVIVPMVLGIILAIYSLCTQYELGVFKVLDFQYHLAIDVLAAVFLAVSPFLFGFIDQAANVWLPHIIVGIAVILVVIFSKPVPASSPTAAF
ncbi:MAG: hypothetical protein WAZ21_04055 [Candidatus Saccharimonadales bacterium]|jgi:hypothetical protein